MSRFPLGSPPRLLLLALSVAGPIALAVTSSVGGPSPAAMTKLEPALLRAAADTPEDTLAAWVEFTDKGEQGPADLARRLAAAEQALSPRNRARRLRAHVHPLVDALDLPVESSYLEALRARGLVPFGASRWLDRAAVRASAAELAALADLSFVRHLAPVEMARRSVDPDHAIAVARPARAAGVASVDYGLMQSPLDQLHVPAVHDSGYTGTGILICVLDEGFNYFDKHEALRDHVIPPERQRDFYRGLSTAQDTTDPTMVHGTWVLGIMAGRKFGTYVGAAYDADYALGRTEVRSFERPIEMVYWGMGAEWAVSLGAEVINSSLGYTTFDAEYPSYAYADLDGHTTTVTRAAEIAASKGILVVTAVGNDGDPGNPWHYLSAPSDANGDSLVAAGAVDASGAPASFSSYGPSADGRIKPDLAARGVQVATCGTSGAPDLYSARDGTSFATPLIAGLVACLLEARPRWSARDVVLALRASATRKGAPDDRVGYGIPNGLAALSGAPTPQVARLTLTSNGPNPVAFARGTGRFTLAVPASLCGASASVRVRDVLGRRVRDLWSGVVSCSPLPMTWDGKDDDGRPVSAGLYLVDVRAGNERATLRLVGLP